MGKISGKDPGFFEVADEGDHILRVKSAEARPPQKEGQGWLYMARSTIEGGENDGYGHFESFFTKSSFGDGLDGCRALLQFTVKIGALTEGKEYDSEVFESQKFADKWPSMVQDKLYKANIKHRKQKDGDIRARSVSYMSVKETPGKPKVKDEFDDVPF